jgi:ubiquinone/menaquinone biosynthesis C-methylase UbiE/DNA-binding transcriptional ArsR family regulator
MQELLSSLRAAAEPTRLRILALCAHAELSVTELTHILGQSQPRVSRHLKLLCDAELLVRSREGIWAYYRTADEGVDSKGSELARVLVDLMPEDSGTLSRDLARLDQVRRERTAAAEAYFRANAEAWSHIRSLYVEETAVERRLLQIAPETIRYHLDLGTGTGRILEVFAPRSQRGLGIDSSREMLAVARVNLARSADSRHLAVRQGDLYNLPLPDACSDFITLHLVLHYLTDPAAAIREAARVLKPGGRLIAVDFAPHDVESLREQHAHRHLGFSDAEISTWYREAGLEPGKVETLPGNPLTVTIWPGDAPQDGNKQKQELES